MSAPARAWLSTSRGTAGAIACIEVRAHAEVDLKELCSGLTLPPVGVAALRDLWSVDEGVVMRWAPGELTVMPHGSVVVIERLLALFGERGALVERAEDPRERFAEAGSLAEACALARLAAGASPRCVNILLGQVALWERAEVPRLKDATASVLERLIEPPLVAAVGRANVGKSTLLNALADRSVSIVSPEAGTTRDGVGAVLELDGLAVRWFDTPGERADAEPAEREAAAAARDVRDAADLVVVCGDLEHGWLEGDFGDTDRVLRCGTRGDLGMPSGAEIVTAADTGEGLVALAKCVRERLVSDRALTEGARSRWVFHPLLACEADR